MMFTTIIWDWNGTLLNDVEINIQIVNTLLEKRNLSQIDKETYRNYFKMPIKNFYKDIGLSFEKETFESIAAEYNRIYINRFSEIKLTDGIIQTLEVIRNRKIDQYIVSASQQKNLDEQVAAKGITQYFKKIVGNDDTAAISKVKKAQMLRKEISNDHKIVFIGDMDHDYEVSQAIGASCILYSNGHQNVAESINCIRIERIEEVLKYL
jgi:phosphoglycolate phosphatase